MSGFAADWLALRAPHDGAARRGAAGLAAGFAAAVGDRATVMDLAAGSGNNVRFLAPTLPNATWVLVDHDAALLSAAAGLGEGRRADLAADDLDALVAGVSGVTTAAFLDLASLPWLERLVTALARHRLPLLASMSVDGRYAWTPSDESDADVMGGFLTDLQGDKGIGGAALGAAAPTTLAALCGDAGYRVQMAATDWQLDCGAADMLVAMVDGLAAAAERRGAAGAVSWRERRRRDLEAGRLAMMLGHQDVLAVM